MYCFKCYFKKIISLVIALFIISALFSGCVTEYDIDDIKKEVEENIGVKNAVVSPSYTEFEGEDGYTDKIWTVIIPDSGITFHVVDDHYWGMESVTNYLRNDYNEAVLAYTETMLPQFEYIKTSSYIEDGVFCGEIRGSYSNILELEECYDELEKINKAFADLGYDNLDISYRLEHIHPLRNATKYVIDEGDIFGHTGSLKTFDDMVKEYMTTVLDYRYEDVLPFSEEEIRFALEDYAHIAGIYRGTETVREFYSESDITYYEDIIANKYGYGISFGSLYEILKREGLNPEGNSRHYTFTGTGGSIYEISYDFTDYPFTVSDSKTLNGYYYIKDGEKVPMEYYFYNHFRDSEIFGMTGLKIVY